MRTVKAFREYTKRVDWKAGNGSILLGTATIFLAFIAMVVILEIFNIQYTHTRTQMLTDIIADGGAVAGNTNNGFNDALMESVADELIDKNGAKDDVSYAIVASPETDVLGHETGNTIVQATIETATAPLFTDYIGYGGVTVKASAEVWVGLKPGGGGWIDTSFAVSPSDPPFVTTEPGYRSGAYVTWFINYFLCPDSNPVYRPSAENSTNYFLHDYLVCMGFKDTYPPRALADWYSLFSGLPSGWECTSNISEAQAAANSGKPVVAFYTNEQGTQDVCIIVPTQGVIDDTQMATAHAGQNNWNYRKIDVYDLDNLEIYYHN